MLCGQVRVQSLVINGLQNMAGSDFLKYRTISRPCASPGLVPNLPLHPSINKNKKKQIRKRVVPSQILAPNPAEVTEVMIPATELYGWSMGRRNLNSFLGAFLVTSSHFVFQNSLLFEKRGGGRGRACREG